MTSQTASERRTFLIVGLGNPGRSYRANRHNAGYHVLDQLASAWGISFRRRQSESLLTDVHRGADRVVLAKPQTFMNRSGRAVAGLVRYYKLPLENLLVVYDDLDLPLAELRMRPEGGAGGHKGMRSLIDQLGSGGFPRLRIGIDRPPGRMDPADYVLQDFSEAEREAVELAIRRAIGCIEHFIREGIQAAMTWCNTEAEQT